MGRGLHRQHRSRGIRGSGHPRLYGGDGSVNCLTDNATVYYYIDSGGAFELETPDRNAVKAAMSNEYAPTQLVIHYHTNPVFSGRGETDIVYQEGFKNLSEQPGRHLVQ
ncbi:hypothetical protein [Streptomyces sp. NPDC006415]|uniref:hypothetical protein n=1 Tax=Streptomyces sp. NPDC006415 TaxID=3155351 RepID=UPI0033B3AB1F